MFNQTKLELKPSIRVAVLLLIPCIATLILILTSQIPFFISFILTCLHLIVSYQVITQFALLRLPSSIIYLEINNKVIYLEEKSGQRYTATPFGKNIIHPVFSLLSFDCNKSNDLLDQTDNDEHIDELNPNSTTEIIDNNIDDLTSDTTLQKILAHIDGYISKIFLSKNRRHLFICRYNAVNSSAFRRVRVWLRYKT